MSKKKEKTKYVDDGHTIYNMDVDGMPHRRSAKENDRIVLDKEERKIAIKAALAHYIPVVLGVVGCFLLAMFLIFLWLH